MPPNARPTTVHPIAIRELEVVRAEYVTPGMRRITLTGSQLAQDSSPEEATPAPVTPAPVTPAFVSSGFDDEVRLIFPYPGESEPVLPIRKPDGGLAFGEGRRPLLRVYTVRRYDPELRELDVDFVVHGVGVATTWALRAAPGDTVHVTGPYKSRGMPSDTDWWLVAGDETALPAISRLLDEFPESARAQVFIEISDAARRSPLRQLPGVAVTWIENAADADDALLEAVRGADWWEGEAFAWLAGEQSGVRDLRRHLVEERSMDKRRIDFSGYWKRGDVVALESDPSIPDPERNDDAIDKLYEQMEILPPLAIRLAVGLGVPELISRRVTTVGALADRTGTDPRALTKLLRYLTAIDILVSVGPDSYGLTEKGEFLTGDEAIRLLHPDGVNAAKELALTGLRESLRTGASAYAGVTGREFATLRREPEFEQRFLDDAAEYAIYTAEPLARAESLHGISHLVVHSPIAAVIAREIVAVDTQIRVSIVALPSAASWLRTELDTVADPLQRARMDIVEQSVFEPSPSADAVLVAQILEQHPDADAGLVLRRAAENLAPGGRLLLLESVYDLDDFDAEDAEDDLLNLALYGSGRRTPDELGAIIDAAGLHTESSEFVGFGETVWRLVRR